MSNLSKHERKKLKKQLGSAEKLDLFLRREKIKSVVKMGSGIIVSLLVLGLLLNSIVNRPQPYTAGEVHWHMPLSYNLCGNTDYLSEKEDHSSIIHGHNDRQIHIEGQVLSADQITLGDFFDSAGVVFAQDQIGPYKNGDSCPGNSSRGKVQLQIDSQDNLEFREHVLKEGEKIAIIFK